MSNYFFPSAAKATSIKCPVCGHEIDRVFKKSQIFGIPKQRCKKCNAEVYIENYIPWQSMSGKQKTSEVLSLIFKSIVLGVAFGGLIGAVLLFILIVVFPYDLSKFPLPVYYSITTLPPVLFFMVRPWFKFFRTYKLGEKWLAERDTTN